MGEPITGLPVATSLSGNEYVPIVQGGVTVRASTIQIANLQGISGTFYVQPVIVVSQNVLAPLNFTPRSNTVVLTINGVSYFSQGGQISFTLNNNTIIWVSSTYTIQTSDNVMAIYAY